jgi:hypothetical protein
MAGKFFARILFLGIGALLILGVTIQLVGQPTSFPSQLRAMQDDGGDGAGGDFADESSDSAGGSAAAASGPEPSIDELPPTAVRSRMASTAAGVEARAAAAARAEAKGLYDALEQSKDAVKAETLLQTKLEAAATKSEEQAGKIADAAEKAALVASGLFADVNNVRSRNSARESAAKAAAKANVAAQEAANEAGKINKFAVEMTDLAREKETGALALAKASIEASDLQARAQQNLANAANNEQAIQGVGGAF